MVRRVKRKKREFWRKQGFIFTVDPFRETVAVIVNMTEPEMKRWAERQPIRPELMERFEEIIEHWDGVGDIGRMGWLGKGGGYVVLLRAKEDAFREAIATIVHEMTHATQHVLRARETPLCPKTDEIYAYVIEDMVRKTLERMWE